MNGSRLLHVNFLCHLFLFVLPFIFETTTKMPFIMLENKNSVRLFLCTVELDSLIAVPINNLKGKYNGRRCLPWT